MAQRPAKGTSMKFASSDGSTLIEAIKTMINAADDPEATEILRNALNSSTFIILAAHHSDVDKNRISFVTSASGEHSMLCSILQAAIDRIVNEYAKQQHLRATAPATKQ